MNVLSLERVRELRILFLPKSLQIKSLGLNRFDKINLLLRKINLYPPEIVYRNLFDFPLFAYRFISNSGDSL